MVGVSTAPFDEDIQGLENLNGHEMSLVEEMAMFHWIRYAGRG